MSEEERRRKADELLEQALQRTGARDPREYYRASLKELREQDRDAYQRAVAHYQEVLIPSVASGTVEPLAAWLEYGRTLAHLQKPGRTVRVDGSGRARPWDASPGEDLVLHLPDDPRARPLLVGLPAEPTGAQRAAYDLLVAGRLTLPTG